MAYGDGGFFFTQPVGNGYSGLGALHYNSPDYSRGYATDFPPASSCLRNYDTCTAGDVRMEVQQVEAALVNLNRMKDDKAREIAAYATARRGRRLADAQRQYANIVAAINDRKRGLEFLQQLGALKRAAQAAYREGVASATTPTLQFTPNVVSMTRFVVPDQSGSDALPDLTMVDPLGPGPMPTLSAEQAEEMGLLAPDGAELVETVSADIEEPEGLMGFFRQNMLISAAAISAVAFFGYRFAKRRGMFA